jgi:hypothetical protein
MKLLLKRSPAACLLPRKRGIGINKIASKLGIGVSVVQRVLSGNP